MGGRLTRLRGTDTLDFTVVRDREVHVMLRKNAKIELLRRVPLFSECSKAQLAEIGMIADEIDVREGTVLIAEGSPGREFFILLEGNVDVTRKGKKLPIRGGG